MTGALILFVLTWLFWWALLVAVYAALLFAGDALLGAHRRRHQARRKVQQELERIDRQADASLQRIGAAYLIAQRLIREEADHGVRR